MKEMMVPEDSYDSYLLENECTNQTDCVEIRAMHNATSHVSSKWEAISGFRLIRVLDFCYLSNKCVCENMACINNISTSHHDG